MFSHHRPSAVMLMLGFLLPFAALAQEHDHSMMDHSTSANAGHEGHDHSMATGGLLGSYAMTRDASGTSWQPDASPHQGIHLDLGDWQTMLHGTMTGVFDHQGGRRGDDDFFSSSMLMAMARRELAPVTIGLRAMMSLEPATNGANGYPLLLQTGETADGRTPLVDRQHPHDLFMELASTASMELAEQTSAFVYFGLPGEPAIGPPAFVHRFAAIENPEAPIAHHWLDSTHISYGVATVGLVHGNAKLEGSVFTGREPDQHRYDIERPRFDSYAVRASWNPTPEWALQASFAALKSPEQLEPNVDVDRITLSALNAHDLGFAHWETTLAWGQNRKTLAAGTNRSLDALLLESALAWPGGFTAFTRLERVREDELFVDPASPLHGKPFAVGKISLGGVYDLTEVWRIVIGIGSVGSIAILPDRRLREAYGDAPLSGMFFVRLKLH
jgi:hypothetical protein